MKAVIVRLSLMMVLLLLNGTFQELVAETDTIATIHESGRKIRWIPFIIAGLVAAFITHFIQKKKQQRQHNK
jgi:hypothetical protein